MPANEASEANVQILLIGLGFGESPRWERSYPVPSSLLAVLVALTFFDVLLIGVGLRHFHRTAVS